MNLIEEHYTATTVVIQPELLLRVITCQPGAHNWVHRLFGTMIVRFCNDNPKLEIPCILQLYYLKKNNNNNK